MKILLVISRLKFFPQRISVLKTVNWLTPKIISSQNYFYLLLRPGILSLIIYSALPMTLGSEGVVMMLPPPQGWSGTNSHLHGSHRTKVSRQDCSIMHKSPRIGAANANLSSDLNMPPDSKKNLELRQPGCPRIYWCKGSAANIN